MYKMTTITNMSLRTGHSTNDAYMMTIGANIEVEGEELWTASEDDAENDVKKGDSWLRVTYKEWAGWMARIHNGKEYCNNFVDATPPPPPTGFVQIDVWVKGEIVFHAQYPEGTEVAINLT